MLTYASLVASYLYPLSLFAEVETNGTENLNVDTCLSLIFNSVLLNEGTLEKATGNGVSVVVGAVILSGEVTPADIGMGSGVTEALSLCHNAIKPELLRLAVFLYRISKLVH